MSIVLFQLLRDQVFDVNKNLKCEAYHPDLIYISESELAKTILDSKLDSMIKE